MNYELPNEKKRNWRFKSWTYCANFLLITMGIWCPGLDYETRVVLIITGSGNLGLREKTQRKIR